MKITEQQMLSRIADIENKILPNEVDEALLFFYKKVSALEEQNSELKKEIKRMRWILEEKD